MRAVACQHAELALIELPEPDPGQGQVRIEVARCGICGSDLHARHEIDQWADLAVKVGYDRFGSSDQAVVFGHEFSGRVAEYGPGCREDVASGATVVALPLLRNEGGIDTTGFSQHAPGAYAEQVLVQESMMMPVPNGLDPAVAALTEPMAVALHAVRRGEVGKRDAAIVIGCGPVGLGVILMLKATGVRTVIASDFSSTPLGTPPTSRVATRAGSRASRRLSSSPSTRARNSTACRSAGGTPGAWRKGPGSAPSVPSSSSAWAFPA
jgi:threonine dehydrogenase-like Zn-dependent dehydrogenase